MPRKRKAAADDDKPAAASASPPPRRGRRRGSSSVPGRGSGPGPDPDPRPSYDPGPPFQSLPLIDVVRLIEPGPVLLVSTGAVADGSHNLMTLGFHMMLQHTAPTLLAVCIGPWDASFRALRAHRQCVLAVPSAEMAADVVAIGNCSQDDGNGDNGDNNKWVRFGLTPRPAAAVTPPLVAGPHILANVECVVHDRSLVGRHNLWILRVVRAWWDAARVQTTGRMLHHRGRGVFGVSTGSECIDEHAGMTKWAELEADDEDDEGDEDDEDGA